MCDCLDILNINFTGDAPVTKKPSEPKEPPVEKEKKKKETKKPKKDDDDDGLCSCGKLELKGSEFEGNSNTSVIKK